MVWDETARRASVEEMAEALRRMRGMEPKPRSVIVHPNDWVALNELREKCLATDPVRGVSCNLPLRHEGDHASVGGYPWENHHYPRPRYEGASEADMAAIEEILGPANPGKTWDELLRDDISAFVTTHDLPFDPNLYSTECDDCGAQPGEACNPDVEH